MAMHHDRTLRTQGSQCPRHRLHKLRREDSQYLMTGVCRVAQRAQQVEDRGKCQRSPRLRRVLRRGVMLNRKAETDAALAQAPRLRSHIGIDVHAQPFQHFCGSSPGPAAVAMLGNTDVSWSRRGDYQRRDR